MTCSPRTLDEVLAVLPGRDGALTPKQVQERVGRWAPITIRHALRELVEDGRASFTGDAGRRRYFNAALDAALKEIGP